MTSAAPAFLDPTSRCAGDAWVDAANGIQNALRYVVWQTPPVYAADGVTILTAGVLQNLTGYTVVGSFYFQSRCSAMGAPLPAAPASPVPVGAVVDPINAIISLSLEAAQTAFAKQSFALWSNPGAALLIAQPRIVDPNGNPVTVGLQQVFVF